MYQRGDKVTIIGPSCANSDAMNGRSVMVRGRTANGMIAVRRTKGDTTTMHWQYPPSSLKPFYQPAKKVRHKKAKAKAKLLSQLDAILKNFEPAEETNPKLAKAQAALKRWTTKLKRATTECRKYAKQVKYYTKKESVQS